MRRRRTGLTAIALPVSPWMSLGWLAVAAAAALAWHGSLAEFTLALAVNTSYDTPP